MHLDLISNPNSYLELDYAFFEWIAIAIGTMDFKAINIADTSFDFENMV